MRGLLYAAALALAALAGVALHWAAANYADAPGPGTVWGDPRLERQPGAHIARAARGRFRELPPNEKRALREALLASLGTLEGWAEDASQADFICLGERHDDRVRQFVASHILPRLDYQVLMIEAGRDRLDALERAYRRGDPVSLLGARFDAILDARGRGGTAPQLVAIDETAAGRERRIRSTSGTREDVMVTRVAEAWRAGQRHLMLIGALHCRDVPGWLFRRVQEDGPRLERKVMRGTAVMGRYQEAGAQLLFYLLEEMDIQREILVIGDVSRFPREILGWLPPSAWAFAGYDSVILFDDSAPRGS